MATKKAISFTVNGQPRTVTTDPGRPLLEVLREDLHLTSTKYGCGEGRCGACTVLLGGKSVHSCITPVADADQQAVLTIEGLAAGDKLHPVQEAFLAEGALRCGYCTPGMIVAVAAPTRFRARQALTAIAETAEWQPSPHPTSKEVGDYLRQRAGGGVPKTPLPTRSPRRPKCTARPIASPTCSTHPSKPASPSPNGAMASSPCGPARRTRSDTIVSWPARSIWPTTRCG